MKDSYFSDADDLNSNLFNDTLTPQEADMIFNDPIYSLTVKDNYGKWDVLSYSGEPMPRRAFKNELRFYFGLTYHQADIAEKKWN